MDCPKLNSQAGVPDEAMMDILARTPFRPVCRSKSVAKDRRDLIGDSLNRGRLPKTLGQFLDIDHFFFLKKRPEIERLCLVDSCNGLLLFENHSKSNIHDVLGYIVCNPATKHWTTVPVCVGCPPSKALFQSDTCLAFDPAASSHFHLLHFWKGSWDELAPKKLLMLPLSVHTYSSETGVWSHNLTNLNEQGQLEGWRLQGSLGYGCDQRTFVNGILYLRVNDWCGDRVKDWCGDQIVGVDVQGRTKRIVKMPPAAPGRRWHSVPYIGQSQGRLHYINRDLDAHDYRQMQGYELSIWVLQDYDTQEWVLKDTVSFLKLFGRMTTRLWDFNIVIIHPDRNVVFFHQRLDRLVIAYDMDSKEVSVVATVRENLVGRIVPYIHYFSESPVLTNKD